MPVPDTRTFFAKLKKKEIALSAALVTIFALLCSGILAYNTWLNEDLNRIACDTIASQTEQQRYHLHTKLENDMRVVQDLAGVLRYVKKDPQEMMRAIKEVMAGTSFEIMAVVDQKGRGIASNGQTVNVSEQPWFAKACQGETSLAMPVSPVTGQGKALVTVATPIAVPLGADDTRAYILIGGYAMQSLQDFMLPAYQGGGTAYLVDHTGNIVLEARTQQPDAPQAPKTLFCLLQKAKFKQLDARKQIFKHLQAGESGDCTGKLNGETQFLHYEPLGVGEWQIAMLAPKSAITRQAQDILSRAAFLSLLVFGLLLLFVFYMAWTKQKNEKQKAAYLKHVETMAYCDTLTGAPNLYGLKRQMAQMLLRNPRTKFSLTKFDIANFKAVNQMFGFQTGDQVLIAVRDAMAQVKAERSVQELTCARVGADEFVVIEECTENEREISHRRRHFESLFRENVHLLLRDYKVDLCYGRCFILPGDNDVEGVLEKANLAHHSAKEKDVKVCEYDESMKADLFEQLSIEHKMEAALESGAFKVFLQPKFALRTERRIGAEALVRWQQDDGSFLQPGVFIPLFERNGFIVQLDLYMFDHVCEILHTWIAQGKQLVPVSVNFSRLHLSNAGFVQQLEQIADRWAVPRRLLEVELTESVFFQNQEALQQLLTALHGAGFLLSMDDFGTGYSSLGLLKDLPVDTIKIDRSFFDESESKVRAKLVIESVMHMAKKLGMHTVAEGVETKEHIDFLRQVGCDIVQGFYYARPVAASEFFSD